MSSRGESHAGAPSEDTEGTRTDNSYPSRGKAQLPIVMPLLGYLTDIDCCVYYWPFPI